MANETTELRHFDSLYTVAEDITRFAPWESGIDPFVLTDPEHPEAYVLVAIEDDGEGTSDIRLMLGLSGIRSWMVEQSASEEADEDNADEFSVERFVGHYDGYYLATICQTSTVTKSASSKAAISASPSVVSARDTAWRQSSTTATTPISSAICAPFSSF